MSQAAAVAGNDRITRILSHPEAFGREAMAQHLATRTTMSVDEAVTAMRTSARQRGGAPPPRTAAQVFAFRQQCVANSRKAGG